MIDGIMFMIICIWIILLPVFVFGALVTAIVKLVEEILWRRKYKK